MQKFTVITVFFLSTISLTAQVGIGTTSPQATLDIFTIDPSSPSEIDGILIPRVDEFPLTNPGAAQDGMMLFVTGAGSEEKGLYYWDHTLFEWVSFLTVSAERIDDLFDGKSEVSGSSLFIGINAGENDDESNNQNVGIGFASLQSNTSGANNMGLGFNALTSNETGNDNVAIGTNALSSITDRNQIVAIGSGALQNSTSPNTRLAIGYQALGSNLTSSENTAVGYRALASLETGVGGNTAIGERTLESTTVGRQNVAIGWRAMGNSGPDVRRSVAIGYQAMSETNGGAGVAIGIESMRFTTSGNENTAVGNRSLYLNTTGSRNATFGFQSLFNNVSGMDNTAVGYQALALNETGSRNTVMGYQALGTNESGEQNVAIGYHAGRNITGSHNVIIGRNAGRGDGDDLNSIDGNVFIGHQAGYFETNSNRLYIHNSDDDEESALIYGEFDNEVLRLNAAVGIGRNPDTNALEVNGEASKTTAGAFIANSDKRLKKNIETIKGKTALDLITKMNGVTYEWNDEVTGNKRPDGKQYGFIAQELKVLFPEKVSLDAQGFYQTAYGDYDALFVQALKELKKENEVLKNKIEKLLQLEERIAMLEKEGIN